MQSSRARVLREGLYAGVIGYVTVALATGLVDLLRGYSFFHTAAVLGSALFGSGAEFAVTPEVVFPYNGVHLLVFLALGFLLAFLVHEIELHALIWYFVFFGLLGLFFVSLFLVVALGEAAGPGVPWALVVGVNSAAALAMGWYLSRRHRDLWRSMRDEADPEEL
ncbi:MAG: hypothetical protein ACODAA_00365 [Gemmatimonadota bacterium]